MALTVAQTADAGAPQAGITIDGLSTTVACTVVVTVSWDGGATWNTVRGGTVTGVLGSTFVRDFVTPLNIQATYQAVVTGGTTVTWTTTNTITSVYAWVQDPLAPKSAVPVWAAQAVDQSALFLLATSFGSFTRKQPASYATPIGASLPVASVGQRQAPSGIPLAIQGLAAAQSVLLASLRSLLNAAGQVVIRGLPTGMGLGPVLHVLTDVTDAPAVLPQPYSTLTLTLNQVQPSTTRIIIPWWTYDQVTALVVAQLGSGATYADVLAAQPTGKTYTEWVANPGTAS